MSLLRASETITSTLTALPRWEVLRRLLDATARRRALAYGVLNDPATGRCCAMGAFWDDNPGASVETALVDEVAGVNDSVPESATDFERWQHVRRWIKSKVGGY